MDWAKTSPAAAAYEKRRSWTKKGSMAGIAPCAKSTARWPPASAPIATLSNRRSTVVDREAVAIVWQMIRR